MKKNPNVLLLVGDTLRLDTLYKNIQNLPGFSTLSKNSIIYTNAISTSPWTAPSHASMFTGKYPGEHGIHYRYDDKEFYTSLTSTPKGITTLAEKFRLAGYMTHSIVTNNLLSKGTMFEIGFSGVDSVGPFVLQEKYRPRMKEVINSENLDMLSDVMGDRSKREFLREYGIKKTFEVFKINREMKRELKKADFPRLKGANQIFDTFNGLTLEEPFFVFFNVMEAHEPYFGCGDFEELVRYHFTGALSGTWPDRNKVNGKLNSIRGRLNKDLQNLDNLVVKLLLSLGSKLQDTIIIFTSDHGQSLGENNYVGHNYMLYNELLKVPLLVCNPDGPKGINTDLVTTLDVYNILNPLLENSKVIFNERNFVYSESFGLSESIWKGRTGSIGTKKKPEVRKRIWSSDGYSLTVNGTNGIIESLEKSGSEIPVGKNNRIVEGLLNELSIFVGSQEFVMPDSAGFK